MLCAFPFFYCIAEQTNVYGNVRPNLLDALQPIIEQEREINRSDCVLDAHELLGALPDVPFADDINRLSNAYEDVDLNGGNK